MDVMLPFRHSITNNMHTISIFKNFTTIIGARPLRQIIKTIRSDRYKQEIRAIRKTVLEGDNQQKDTLKKQLPAFTVSGKFEGGRTMDKLVDYCPFVILDIDKIPVEVLARICRKVQDIDYTLAGFISPSGQGYKIIVRTNATVQQHAAAFKQVAAFYEDQLQVEIDHSGKDITRLCFMSWDEDAFFNENSMPFIVEDTKEKATITAFPLSNVNTDENYEEQLLSCMDYTRQKYVYQNGNRNNFVYFFGSNCNRIGIPEEAALSFARKQFEMDRSELEKTMGSAYKHHRKEANTKRLKMVNKAAQEDELGPETIGEVFQTSPFLPDTLYDQLPKLLQESCKTFTDRREKDVFFTCAITILGGCMPHLTGVYRGEVQHPNLYCFVMGPAASGKGVLKYAYQMGKAYDAYLLKKNQELRRAYNTALLEYKKGVSAFMRNKQPTPPVEPTPPQFQKLYLTANTSTAKLMEDLQHAKGCSIMVETEATTMNNALKQDWSSYRDILCKAFHYEHLASNRKTQHSNYVVSEPKLCIALSGTPDQALRLLYTAEDGLFSRFIPYAFNASTGWRDYEPGIDKRAALKDHFSQLAEEVLAMALHLESHPTKVDITDEQMALLNDSFRQMHDETTAFVSKEAEGTIKRLGVICFRLVMILTAMRKFEARDTTHHLICRDDDFLQAIQLVKVYREHAMLLFKHLPKSQKFLTE